MKNQIARGKSASTRTPSLAAARTAMLSSVLQPVAEPVLEKMQTASVAKPRPASLMPAQRLAAPAKRRSPAASANRFAATSHEESGSNRQAELFYLQKQIQLQTQMVFILEDGARIQGVIEWYDRHSIKIRGKSRVLVYKAAIKYLYKAGEIGAASE